MKYGLMLAAMLLALLLPQHGVAQSALENEVPPTPVAARYSSHGRPPSGIGGVVMGAVGLGLGGINLATIPVCYASYYPADAKDLCVALSIGLGTALVAVGIPSLIVGLVRRKRYKAWRQERIQGALPVKGIALAPMLGGAQFLVRTSF